MDSSIRYDTIIEKFDPEGLIDEDLQTVIPEPVSRLDGVATVEAHGLEEKEILIELNRARVEGSGLNIYTLAQELGSDNFTLASGNVMFGSKKLLLRSVARYGSIEELENRMVSPTVRLRG